MDKVNYEVSVTGNQEQGGNKDKLNNGLETGAEYQQAYYEFMAMYSRGEMSLADLQLAADFTDEQALKNKLQEDLALEPKAAAKDKQDRVEERDLVKLKATNRVVDKFFKSIFRPQQRNFYSGRERQAAAQLLKEIAAGKLNQQSNAYYSAYEKLKQTLLSKVTPDKQIKVLTDYLAKKGTSQGRGNILDRIAAECLWEDINTQQNEDKIKREVTIQIANLIKGYRRDRFTEIRSPRQNELYDFLCQMQVKGMTAEQMKRDFLGRPDDIKLAPEAKDYAQDPNWQKIVRLFLADLSDHSVSAGEIEGGVKGGVKHSNKDGKFEVFKHKATVNMSGNPAAWLMTKMIIAAAPAGFKEQEFTQLDWEQLTGRLVESIKDIWQNFYYSGRWSYNSKTKEWELTDKADLDAKVAMYLFQKAGFKKALDAQPLRIGSELPLKGLLADMGGRSGISLAGETLIIDNHQPGRGFPTSSSKIIHNLLSESGLLKSNYQLRFLTELTVDDDSGRLFEMGGLTGRSNGLWRDKFINSGRTMRGLFRFCPPQKIVEYFTEHWTEAEKQVNGSNGDKGRMIYQALLDRSMSDQDMLQLGLAELVSKKSSDASANGVVDKEIIPIEPVRRYQKSLARAQKMLFNVPEEELYRQGRLIDSRLGKVVVNIESTDPQVPKFLGGHYAVRSDPRGFNYYLSYEPKNNSLAFNTSDSQVDLSEEFRDFLEVHKDLVPVRGALLIKPRGAEPLSFKFEDFLKEIGYDINQSQGLVREYFIKQGILLSTDKVKAAATTSAVIQTKQRFASLATAENNQDQSEGFESKYLGIKFSRELTDNEQKIKDDIDNHIRQVLLKYIESVVKSKESSLEQTKLNEIIERQIDLAFKNPQIVEQLSNRYRQAKLPLAIDKS